jgi:hypothetical protein
MLRKTIIALLALASMAVFVPIGASARGGGGGGGHGGMGGGMGMGMGGGMHVGGGMGGHMHIGGGRPHFGGFHHRFGGIGFGFYGPYYDDDYYYPYESYPSYGDEGYGDCYLVKRRVHTRHGWRRRIVRICQ